MEVCRTAVQQTSMCQQGITAAVIPLMTSAVLSPSSPPRLQAAGRFGLALMASAAFHFLLPVVMMSDTPWRSARQGIAAPITVRLESQPWMASANPTPIDSKEPSGPRPTRRPVAVPEDVRHKAAPGPDSGKTRDTAGPLALPQVPDPTYYSARDLDVYPRPIVPLELDRLAGGVPGEAAARFRLVLLIDERGIVSEIAVVEADPPGRLEEALRARLAATGFFPAMKDGRAVKSRVELSVTIGRKGADRQPEKSVSGEW